MKESTYVPISCSYYDELEALATLRRTVAIVYQAPGTPKQTIQARIVDFRTENKVEYMLLDNGLEIRLDWLIAADGKPVPKAC